MAELTVAQVTKRFGDFTAVDEVDLVVPDQEFMVLLGPSGCGKSTLLRSIAGLEQVTSGRIAIGGRDVTRSTPRDRRISMVFQSYAVFPHMTVFDNIAFGLRRQKKEKEEIDNRVQRSAELLHIEDLLERYPNSLSGGQRQRVAVARSIAYDADVLLMDEPLSNLDALLRMEMRAELKSLVRELRTTVIYVTHDQVEAMSLGDRIGVLEGGAIQQVGPPVAVYDNPANTFVAGFIGNPPMNLIPVTVAGSEVRVADQVLALEGASGDGAHVLGVRAENLTVADEGEGLEARVVVTEPLGSHNLLTCSVADTLVKVSTRPDESLDPGSRVRLRPIPDKVRWFDPETGWAR